MQFFNSDKIYDLMRYKIPFLGLSLFLFLASIGLLSTKGLNFGIDFVGGSVIQVKYTTTAPIDLIRAELEKTQHLKNAVVSEFGSDDEVLIKITNTSTDLGSDIGDQITSILAPTGEFELRRVDMVGPKVGNELKEKGIIALSLTLLVILIYISFRFEWRFAVASIIALVHDIIIAIGFISLFSVEVNLDILAALLTILGYSINDTIIIFDRIREGVSKSISDDLNYLVNHSISNTLARTTLTSLTTLFVVFTLYLFGSEIISGFAFTLLIGIVIGTYSSIFIATTILVQLRFSVNDFRQKEAEKVKKQKEKDRMRAMYEKGIV